MSTWLLLVVLAAAWAAVLVPDYLRRSSMTRRNDTMGAFSRNMGSLGRPQARSMSYAPRNTAPRPVRPHGAPVQRAARVSPQRRAAQAQRRQEVLMSLVAAAVLTFLGAVSVGGVFVAIHVIADLALVAYVGALATMTRREVAPSNVSAMPARRDVSHVVPAYARQPQRVAR